MVGTETETVRFIDVAYDGYTVRIQARKVYDANSDTSCFAISKLLDRGTFRVMLEDLDAYIELFTELKKNG